MAVKATIVPIRCIRAVGWDVLPVDNVMELAKHPSFMGNWAAWIWNPGGAIPNGRRSTMHEAADTRSEPADAELFDRIARGDEAAFATFYDRHATLLYSIAFRIVGDATEAEDILQEAAVLIWERAPAYSPALGKPASWAVTIVRNKAIDRYRSSRRKAAVLTEMPGDTGGPPVDDREATRPNFDGTDAAFIRKALDNLAADQRQAIELAFFGGLTQTEIAERLGQPLGTIKARIRRGMLHMRDALEGAL